MKTADEIFTGAANELDGTRKNERKKGVQKPACFLELFSFIGDNLVFIVCIHRKSIFIK